MGKGNCKERNTNNTLKKCWVERLFMCQSKPLLFILWIFLERLSCNSLAQAGSQNSSIQGKMTDFKDCSLVRLKTHTIWLGSEQVFWLDWQSFFIPREKEKRFHFEKIVHIHVFTYRNFYLVSWSLFLRIQCILKSVHPAGNSIHRFRSSKSD